MLATGNEEQSGRRLAWWTGLMVGTLLFCAAVATSAKAAAYVYVADSNSVFQYGTDPAGALSPLAPPTAPAGQFPNSVAVSPNGQWAYVTDVDGVTQYDLKNDGLLVQKTPTSVPAERQPAGIAVSPEDSPNRSSVYVANSMSSTISQYTVGDSGGLSPMNPASVDLPIVPGSFILAQPAGLAVSPDGRSVYVASFGIATDGSNVVYQLDVQKDGTLSLKDQPTVTAGDRPRAVAVSPDGDSVYVTNGASDTISQYDVNAASGALTPKRAGEIGAGISPGAIAVSPDGSSVYVANNGDPGTGAGSVSQYTVGRGGALRLGSTTSAGTSPASVAISPDGGSVYVTDHGLQGRASGGLYQFDVGQGGALSPKNPASVRAGGAPLGLAVSPAIATGGPDLLTGTAGDNLICGLGGSDTIRGLGGDDKLYGDRCGARVSVAGRGRAAAARAGQDVLHGGTGTDRLYGGRGKDRLHGGPGKDRLHGGPGKDRLRGGAGRDTLHVSGGGRDRVHCGKGRDTVRADRHDVLRSCERVARG
jgi:DNA-binding beta-propeller fold protein YncE